jgi:hypothetical protein
MLYPLMKRKFDLYVRNGVLLYQLIRPMMVYAWRWMSTARTYFQSLKVSQPCAFASILKPPPTLQADKEGSGRYAVCRSHQSPNHSFESKLADVRNPLVRQLGRYDDRDFTPSSDAEAKTGRWNQASWSRRPRCPRGLNYLRSVLINPAPFGYPAWRFSVIFHQL